jgi:lipid-binding SYLF domain-containing protein
VWGRPARRHGGSGTPFALAAGSARTQSRARLGPRGAARGDSPCIASFAAIGVTTAAALVLGGAHPLTASKTSSDEVERLQNSIAVLHDLTSSPDRAIPRHLLERSEAIVVIPTLIKGGFIVGAKHGRGVMSSRDNASRSWSSPAFVTMTGGTIGWQIGLESVDLVLLVMNRKGVEDLLEDKFTLGGTASVAAGPVGRSADATTDAKLSSQILAYSRANGLFAGATLEGAALHGDKDANQAFYGTSTGVRAIVMSHERGQAPKIADVWCDTLAALAGAKAPEGPHRRGHQ